MRKTTAPTPPPEMPKDFIEANRPRHEAFEAMQKLIAAPQEDIGKSFAEYVGTFTSTADTARDRAKNLLDLYSIDPRQIYQDAQERPEHYDERQHEILNHLLMGLPLSREATDAEKDELLLTFFRRRVTDEERETRALEQDRLRRKKEQEENDEIMLENGQSLSDAIENEKLMDQFEGVFEKQDFGDKVIV